MASATAEQDQTVADLLDRLGGIPASRVRLVPTPGTATEQDVIDVHDRTNRLCELVDGVLVEKVMGFDESSVLGPACDRFLAELSEASRPRQAHRRRRHDATVPRPCANSRRRVHLLEALSEERRGSAARSPRWHPTLSWKFSARETPRARWRKLDEYFRAGVLQVWYVDPKRRKVRVFTGRDHSVVLGEDRTSRRRRRPSRLHPFHPRMVRRS